MRWEQRIRYGSISDVGFRRGNNEDAYTVHVCAEPDTWQRRGHVFMVADGMGGHAVGELASKMAVDTLPQSFLKHGNPRIAESLRESIVETNRTIFRRGEQNSGLERMGTTCSVLVLSAEGAIVGHVGDSRVYRVRNNRIDQLSFDHSLHWELARSGRMSLGDLDGADGKNIITRCLGPKFDVDVDIEGPFTICDGDCYVLCSDGLTNHVKDEEIGIIARELPPDDACRLLVNLANLRGGSDNTTVLVVDVGNTPDDEAVQPSAAHEVHGRHAWPRLLAAWGISATFVVGGLLVVQQRLTVGFTVLILSLIAAAGSLARWWRSGARRGSEDVEASNLPHRSARFRLDHEFVAAIATMVTEFAQTARTKGLTVREAELRKHRSRARAALERADLSDATRLYAKSIDVLMDTVHEYRRRRNRQQRWGRSVTQSRGERG